MSSHIRSRFLRLAPAVHTPRYWKFVDAFPMTVTGKVQKFKMRDVSISELGLERAAGTRTA
jgi:fatty-acyl-CoA synthase